MENGLLKNVTEAYLVEALSFTEAEARFLEEVTPFMSGEFEVSDIKKSRINELFESNDNSDDRWFKSKLAFVTLDEKTGVEKRTNHLVLVQAKDLRTAVKNIDAGMAGTMSDYVIVNVAETALIDLFHYTVKEEQPEFPEA